MATIYKLNLDDLTLDTIIKVDDYLELYGIVSITHLENLYATDLNILKYEYPHYDTYYSEHGEDLSSIHCHIDEEVRLIIHGTATFYIPDGKHLYVAECSALDQVKLQPNITHWFSKSGELLAYRFFKSNESYELYEPKELPNSILEAKKHFDNNPKLFLL